MSVSPDMRVGVRATIEQFKPQRYERGNGVSYAVEVTYDTERNPYAAEVIVNTSERDQARKLLVMPLSLSMSGDLIGVPNQMFRAYYKTNSGIILAEYYTFGDVAELLRIKQLGDSDAQSRRLTPVLETQLLRNGYPEKVDWVATAVQYLTGREPNGEPVTADTFLKRVLVPYVPSRR